MGYLSGAGTLRIDALWEKDRFMHTLGCGGLVFLVLKYRNVQFPADSGAGGKPQKNTFS